MAKEMHEFIVPVYYEMCEYVHIEAPADASRKELNELALEQFHKEPLHLDGENYLPDSEETDDEAVIRDATAGEYLED